jgi:hypothetical protein
MFTEATVRALLRALFGSLFGCRHSRIGTPVTLPGSSLATVLCRDCGARLTYDVRRMRQGKKVDELADGRADGRSRERPDEMDEFVIEWPIQF